MVPKIFAGLLAVMGWSSASANAIEYGLITNIVVEGSNSVSVFLNSADDTTDCLGGARWTLAMDEPLAKEKYALLLQAAATGKLVELLHVASSGCGPSSSNKIYYVQIRP